MKETLSAPSAPLDGLLPCVRAAKRLVALPVNVVIAFGYQFTERIAICLEAGVSEDRARSVAADELTTAILEWSPINE